MRLARLAMAVVVSGVLGACGSGAGSGAAVQEAAPAQVGVVRVEGTPLDVSITSVGTIEPENRVVVAAQEEGVVTALNVREGDVVTRGDVVVQLDDREIAAALQEEQARLAESEGQWNRSRSLVEEGLITQASADSARATFQVEKARVDALRTRLSFTRVVAPVGGVVTVRHVELGDLVKAGAAVVDLAAGRRVLRVPVSELDVVHLGRGDAATVSVDALPGAELPARIERIFPAADAQSRQVTVELVLNEVPQKLRPGFLARAKLVLERIPDAIMVPEPAVMRGSEVGSFVYVVTDGVAHVRAVTLGQRESGKVRIVKGLEAGDRVVVEGMGLLRDEAPVAASERGEGA